MPFLSLLCCFPRPYLPLRATYPQPVSLATPSLVLQPIFLRDSLMLSVCLAFVYSASLFHMFSGRQFLYDLFFLFIFTYYQDFFHILFSSLFSPILYYFLLLSLFNFVFKNLITSLSYLSYCILEFLDVFSFYILSLFFFPICHHYFPSFLCLCRARLSSPLSSLLSASRSPYQCTVKQSVTIICSRVFRLFCYLLLSPASSFMYSSLSSLSSSLLLSSSLILCIFIFVLHFVSFTI